MWIRVRLVFIRVLVFIFLFSAQFCLGQEGPQRVNSLQAQIKSCKTIQQAQPLIRELLELSYKENKFNELYNFLEELGKRKLFTKDPYLYYYKALTRSRQIDFLEKNKLWQELFDNKNTYIAQLEAALEKSKKLNTQVNALALRLKLLETKIKKEDEGALVSGLEDLSNLAREYANVNTDMAVVKEIAEELSRDKQTIYARKLYNIYVSGLAQSNMDPQDLMKIAEGFLEENNVGLAVSLYDASVDKLVNSSPDNKDIARQMFEVAQKFEHIGWQEARDPFFAEKVYNKIYSLYNLGAFSDASQYHRAYNLERIKEYEQCLQEYAKLVDDFPQYKDKDRIYFRMGVISAYIFGRADEARKYFSKILDEFPQSQDYFNSLYHLGLLEHWFNNLEKAKERYQEILDKTKDYKDKPEIARMAQARLEEIQGQKPIEYNLKTFLEAVLQEKKETDRPSLQLELFAKEPKDYLNEAVTFKVSSYLTDTGCLQQDWTYLWSGNLGRNQTPFNNYEFETDYSDNLGTKVVNVVLVGPSGVVGGVVEMADIYDKM